MLLSRRDLFRGASLGAAGLVLAPLLNRFDALANGLAVKPRRVVFVLQCNGFSPAAAQPVGLERLGSGPERVVDLDLTRYELSEDLSPLAPHKQRVTILQRLNGVHSRPYHLGGFAALAGSLEAKKAPLAETIDAALSKALPGVFPVVGLGMDPSTPQRANAYVCSAWGPNQPIPTQCRPDRAYQSLFGSVAPGVGLEDFNAKSQLLDFMQADIRQVQARLVGDEKVKFDYYLNAFESMSQRMAKLKDIEPQLKANIPTLTDHYSSDNECKRLEAQFELAAATLVAGLTNVVTIMSGTSGPGGAMPGLGIDIGLHQMAHGMSDKGREPKELFTLIRKYHLGLIAKLVEKLQAIPEGDGTMMDNTLIVYTSDAGHGHHSDGSEWPFVLVGDLGGRLRSGRFIEYPGYNQAGNRTINALYATFLHAAGAPRDRFNLTGGLKDVDSPGPLSELLA